MTRHLHLDADAVRQLTLSTDPWLSCDDCFALMDQYVEAVLTDPSTPGWSAMRAHLRGCGACAEEVEGLRTLVGSKDLDQK